MPSQKFAEIRKREGRGWLFSTGNICDGMSLSPVFRYLEIKCTGNRTGGSNPSLSANSFIISFTALK